MLSKCTLQKTKQIYIGVFVRCLVGELFGHSLISYRNAEDCRAPVTDQRISRFLSSLQRLEGRYSESGTCFLDGKIFCL